MGRLVKTQDWESRAIVSFLGGYSITQQAFKADFETKRGKFYVLIWADLDRHEMVINDRYNIEALQKACSQNAFVLISELFPKGSKIITSYNEINDVLAKIADIIKEE